MRNQLASNQNRLLLVEDVPVVARVCTRILTSQGFDVDVAGKGRIAKDATEKNDYDLCVSDIRLPEMTGIELYKILHAHQSKLIHRMIFITGDTMHIDVRLFLKESGIPCLMKPFSPEELVAAISKISG